ncbi:ATP-binding protein [Kitasatospora sp. NBC_01560]|uniref:AAA family ATPase n=1 Tax=Kitasatospora sp. NBC_01560 TaxID=2975965 RepID=UPI00386E4235
MSAPAPNAPAPSGPKLKTRRPTGIVPWPLILIEGEEKAGKTYSAAEFSGSDKIGQMYWIDLDEGSADEYAAIPGSHYLIIEHDGTYRDILEQIEAVHAEARRAALAGEPPVVLTIDSGSALWRMLTNWTHERARRTKKNKALLEADPDAAIDISMNLWNDSVERWARVMWLLRTLPGISIILARGKQISAVDDNGTPIKNKTEWRVQAQKDLGFDSTVWVRLRRDEDPQIIAARSLRLRVERKKPRQLREFSIETLVFDMLGCSQDSQPRVLPALAGDRVQPWLERIATVTKRDELAGMWKYVGGGDVGLSRHEVLTVRAEIERRAAEIDNPQEEMPGLPGSDAEKLRAAAERKAAAGAGASAEVGA